MPARLRRDEVRRPRGRRGRAREAVALEVELSRATPEASGGRGPSRRCRDERPWPRTAQRRPARPARRLLARRSWPCWSSSPSSPGDDARRSPTRSTRATPPRRRPGRRPRAGRTTVSRSQIARGAGRAARGRSSAPGTTVVVTNPGELGASTARAAAASTTRGPAPLVVVGRHRACSATVRDRRRRPVRWTAVDRRRLRGTGWPSGLVVTRYGRQRAPTTRRAASARRRLLRAASGATTAVADDGARRRSPTTACSTSRQRRAVALRLLGQHHRLVWYVPDVGRHRRRPTASDSPSLLPPWLLPARCLAARERCSASSSGAAAGSVRSSPSRCPSSCARPSRPRAAAGSTGAAGDRQHAGRGPGAALRRRRLAEPLQLPRGTTVRDTRRSRGGPHRARPAARCTPCWASPARHQRPPAGRARPAAHRTRERGTWTPMSEPTPTTQDRRRTGEAREALHRRARPRWRKAVVGQDAAVSGLLVALLCGGPRAARRRARRRQDAAGAHASRPRWTSTPSGCSSRPT